MISVEMHVVEHGGSVCFAILEDERVEAVDPHLLGEKLEVIRAGQVVDTGWTRKTDEHSPTRVVGGFKRIRGTSSPRVSLWARWFEPGDVIRYSRN